MFKGLLCASKNGTLLQCGAKSSLQLNFSFHESLPSGTVLITYTDSKDVMDDKTAIMQYYEDNHLLSER